MEKRFVQIVADWDEAIGPQVIDFHINEIDFGDPEVYSINTFMTFQNLYDSTSNSKFERTYLTMPLKSQELISRVLFDVVPDLDVRGGLRPFFTTIIVPDLVFESEIVYFDSILNEISAIYKKEGKVNLKEFKDEIMEKINIIENKREIQVVLEDSYSLTKAAEDFKKGIQLFQQKKWDLSYPLIKKSLIKFEEDRQIQLQMEANYLLGTILVQMRKFEASIPYFSNLYSQAESLNHQKYKEISKFMQGFSYYKINDELSALDIFDEINIENAQFVNKMRYFFLKGKICANLKLYEKAINNYNKSLEFSVTQKESNSLKKQRGQILYDIGLQYYRSIVDSLKKTTFEASSFIKSQDSALNNAIEFFQSSIDAWTPLQDYSKISSINQIISNIYRFQGDEEKSLGYLYKSLEFINELNDNVQKLKIINQIVQVHGKNEEYEKIINILVKTLQSLKNSAFIDRYTLAEFHFKLGEAYFHNNQQEEALLELVGSLNIFKKIKDPVPQHLEVLKVIREIYQLKGESEKLAYYDFQIEELNKKFSEKTRGVHGTLGLVKDVWFFTETGLELFSYAPEMNFDPTLLGGFLTAMQGFSFEISNQHLEGMEIGDSKYFFYRKPDRSFYMLARASKKVSEKSVENILGMLYAKFFDEFKTHLEKFSGNVVIFENFKKILLSMDFSMY